MKTTTVDHESHLFRAASEIAHDNNAGGVQKADTLIAIRDVARTLNQNGELPANGLAEVLFFTNRLADLVLSV